MKNAHGRIYHKGEMMLPVKQAPIKLVSLFIIKFVFMMLCFTSVNSQPDERLHWPIYNLYGWGIGLMHHFISA